MDQSELRLRILKEYYEAERDGRNVSLDVEGLAKSWGVTKREIEFGVIYLVRGNLLRGEFVAGTDVPVVLGLTSIGVDAYERQARRKTQVGTSEEKPKASDTMKAMQVATPSSNFIFIVHGHDAASKEELARILEKLGLVPVILHEQPQKGRVLIEKLEDHTSEVDYAFILLTPDDIGSQKDAKPEQAKPRARQNVIFEFGYLMGKLGRDRICCLYTGDIELPTDLEGIVYVSFNKSVHEAYEKIVAELRAAGYQLNP